MSLLQQTALMRRCESLTLSQTPTDTHINKHTHTHTHKHLHVIRQPPSGAKASPQLTLSCWAERWGTAAQQMRRP